MSGNVKYKLEQEYDLFEILNEDTSSGDFADEISNTPTEMLELPMSIARSTMISSNKKCQKILWRC